MMAIIGWRRNRLGSWAPLLVTVLELGVLVFVGPTWWSWPPRLPEESPVLLRLAALPGVGLVAGRLQNLPVDAGRATAYPTLGITPPPPNYLLEPAIGRLPKETTPSEHRWQRRLGVTHGVWGHDDDIEGTEPLAEMADPALDRVLATVPNLRGRGPWKVVRTPSVFPPAWAASRVREASSWGGLFSELSLRDAPDDAWFLTEDHPPSLPGPSARVARVESWDGQKATVAHDGSCILIMRRTYYPGWFYRVDGGAEEPVLKVDGGLQGAVLVGSGTSHVVVHYRPTGLARAVTVSIAALAVAAFVLGLKLLTARPGWFNGSWWLGRSEA
jgi:hypothetical protein